ncbi:MAG TPA: glycine oxidase ThiO [Propionibacteriaceae bacterium]|nr:glycine oxidase ThiO [Propionibacteriaceae bacterium]
MASPQIADVVVIGGGLIGTAIAWQLRLAGRSVVVLTGERSSAASRVAAGMLAPVTETTFTEGPLLALNQASLASYDTFVAQLEDASGLPAGLRRTPTLSVAGNADDAARLQVLADYLSRLGLGSERLTSSECRRQEPLLSPTIRSGLLVPGDWSCDNRLLWAALIEASRRAGVVEVDQFAHEVRSSAGRVSGVVTADGSVWSTSQVVLANGAWAAQVAGIPPIPVRPVKGQILRLDPLRMPAPRVTVRAYVSGSEVYLVPRESGREVVVGATVEELGFDRRVTAGATYELLRDARQVLPMTTEYVLAETSVGFRPGTPDNAPILGGCDLDGLVLATGHYRNGVLLTPFTATAVTALLEYGALPRVATEFTLDRFTRAPAAAPRAKEVV